MASFLHMLLGAPSVVYALKKHPAIHAESVRKLHHSFMTTLKINCKQPIFWRNRVRFTKSSFLVLNFIVRNRSLVRKAMMFLAVEKNYYRLQS